MLICCGFRPPVRAYDERRAATKRPPAVISIFWRAADIRILKRGHQPRNRAQRKKKLLTGVKSLPLLTRDDSPHRTSPFALHTSLSFGMVGSSQGSAIVNAVLNALWPIRCAFADDSKPPQTSTTPCFRSSKRVYDKDSRIS